METSREGFGLHTGAAARVVLRARPGPLSVRAAGREATIDELALAGGERATSVEVRGVRVRTVEHLFAAFGGLGVREGVGVLVDGGEVPLLDGGAREWVLALGEIGAIARGPSGRSGLVVAREGRIDVGESVYTFRPGTRRIRVRVEFGDARVAPEAEWDGEPEDFAARIAPARTFAREQDLDELAAGGLASRVSPESVVVFGPSGIFTAGRAFEPDEPARHKLLDLVGDAYLYGGPPEGELVALRPGHAATHTALRAALEQGILVACAMYRP
jgi:UDP-3-O-[3-hydroxymyristoyl] N-acetylglucosamine deacetylase